MAMTRTTARRLCTAPEYALFEASMAAEVKHLTPGRLGQKVQRARRLRDKYRDLARRQRLEARGKTGPRRARPAQGQENTDRKAQLFQEVLERFETRLAALDPGSRTRTGGAPNRSTAGTAGGKKTGAKKTGAKKSGAKKSGAKKTGARKTGAKKTGAKKSGAKKSAADSPAGGGARPAAPGHTGPSARKGARSRAAAPAREEASRQGREATARAHTRASNRRSQQRRDRRG
jgi:hypothetical protein